MLPSRRGSPWWRPLGERLDVALLRLDDGFDGLPATLEAFIEGEHEKDAEAEQDDKGKDGADDSGAARACQEF
jgi:hypothetical protein